MCKNGLQGLSHGSQQSPDITQGAPYPNDPIWLLQGPLESVIFDQKWVKKQQNQQMLDRALFSYKNGLQALTNNAKQSHDVPNGTLYPQDPKRSAHGPS